MNNPHSINDNIAETLAREMKQPIVMLDEPDINVRRVALPAGWKLQEQDNEPYLPTPRRKHAKVCLRDTDSFVDYVKRHGSLTNSTIWCMADYKIGKINFLAIINDHGEDHDQAAWRDHTAQYQPEFSEEWNRWTGNKQKPMTQTEFAAFIESNLKDITSDGDDTLPSGASMLEMAISFEANQDSKFKSAIRLQNGGIQMSFTQEDDSQTIQKMQMFDRFAIGIPVFWNGDAYKIDARLRYRVREGKLTFWFELIRHDKTLEAATKMSITSIRDKTGRPFFFGDPFLA